MQISIAPFSASCHQFSVLTAIHTFHCSGGEGMGPVEKTVDGLAAALGAECQLVVVCGRNAKLVQRLSSKRYPEGMQVRRGLRDGAGSWLAADHQVRTGGRALLCVCSRSRDVQFFT